MVKSFNKRLALMCEKRSSSLCIGLDIDPDKFSKSMDKSILGLEHFGKDVIDSTIDFCPIYKPNFAFYERFGSKGLSMLERLVDHIDRRAIVIADAKRGDIGNTSRQYAHAILHKMGCDAITISPYMGEDSILPFIINKDKGVFILAVTSNSSASTIQTHGGESSPLYKKVIKMAKKLNTNDNIGLVVGATKTSIMDEIRQLSIGMPWLIPGVGSQGGDLENALEISSTNGIGIINISRGILYSGDGSIESIANTAKIYTEKIRSIAWNPIKY
tara:strand:- start:748 stop:1566 length:819 start_codon:yes stop_codon:yes gene_type:complete